jgi:hypothetical protein
MLSGRVLGKRRNVQAVWHLHRMIDYAVPKLKGRLRNYEISFDRFRMLTKKRKAAEAFLRPAAFG